MNADEPIWKGIWKGVRNLLPERAEGGLAEKASDPISAPRGDVAPESATEPSPESTAGEPSEASSQAVADAEASPTTPPPAESTGGDELRARLVRQFEGWLDRMLAEEPPPQGLPEGLLAELQAASDEGAGASAADSDLYAMCSALTTLSGEVRLQGRAFKQLTDVLAPLGEAPARLAQLETAQRAATGQMAQLVEKASESAAREKALPPSKELLSLLLDLYDRLERGLRTFDSSIDSLHAQSKPGWVQRLFGGRQQAEQAAAADAMREGYRLTLSRLEAALHQWDIQRIGMPGEAFDPELMTAFEVQETPDAEDGTVLEVYRSGYMLHGQLLAAAQVKVARAARPEPATTDD